MLPGGLILTALTLPALAHRACRYHLPLNGTTVPLAFFIAVVPIALGNLMWHTGVSCLGVSLMAIFANFVPAVAIRLAIWFGEVPT